MAVKLSETYLQNEMTLQASLRKILGQQLFSTLRVGALEGLSILAMNYVHALFNEFDIKEIHLDIFEIGELESHFEAGELDLIFSFKVPGRQKYKNILEVGYQSVNPVNTDGSYMVSSPYEFSQYKLKGKKLNKKFFLSNSLFLRKKWLKKFKGMGYLPSKIDLKPSQGKLPLYLVGSDLLSPQIWNEVINIPRTEEMLRADLIDELKA